MANASHKGQMGTGHVVGHQNAGTADPNTLDEGDLAQDIMGSNKLQGADQSRFRNERQAVPGSQDLRNQPEEVLRRIREEAEASASED